ncbi:MAG: hypothetical protein ACREA0_12575, partial [bacterium]
KTPASEEKAARSREKTRAGIRFGRFCHNQGHVCHGQWHGRHGRRLDMSNVKRKDKRRRETMKGATCRGTPQ